MQSTRPTDRARAFTIAAVSLVLVLTTVVAAEQADDAGVCGVPVTEDGRNYSRIELLEGDPGLRNARNAPVVTRIPGERPSLSSFAESLPGDADTHGRWLPGYRPNTPEAWRAFEAWMAEERRSRATVSVTVPGSPVGPVASVDPDAAPRLSLVTQDESPRATVREQSYPASVIDVRSIEVGAEAPTPGDVEARVKSADPRTGIPWEQYNLLKEDARTGPETPGAQFAEPRWSDAPGFQGTSFGAFDTRGSLPPDPILTVGPGHIVALVNQAFRVWNKSGAPMSTEIPVWVFFNGVPGCESPFDVFADYDEQLDRFVVGGMSFSGSDTNLCVAATATGDPTGEWNRYAFAANALLPTAGIDYPHLGIGLDAVYIGANMFDNATGQYDSSRVYALDKSAMYAGAALQVAEFGIGNYRTPQPSRMRGFHTGQWPAPGSPHHILTQELGLSTVRVYRWADPFAPSDPTVHGDVLTTYLGVAPNAPELGDGPLLDHNDTSAGPLLDAEYRDGAVWSTRTVFCNLDGGDTEACIDWFKIDVTGGTPFLADQQVGGAFGSADEFRYYPDLAVDRNGNMAIGYTKSSFADYTQIWVTGREATDPAGTLQSEVLQIAGAGNYTDGAGCGGNCDRWGDYTGMAADPDGCTFWYIGEYSDGGEERGPWRTHIGSYRFDTCSVDSSVNTDRGTYSCDDVMTVEVVDSTRTDAATVAAATVISATADTESISEGAWVGSDCIASDCGTWTATLAISGGAGANGDGTLNVVNGDSVSVDYADPHPGHDPRSRNVSVTCQTRFEDGGYLILGGCEAGTGAERYRDYIDAGEYINYVVGIYNPGSAPALTDLSATLSITGPLAGSVTIANPTVHIGAVSQGQLSGPVFDILLDPSAAGSGLSPNDFHVTLTSIADGYTIPQVLTHAQLLQTDDNVLIESACFNMETDQGFETAVYEESYKCVAPCSGQTVTSIAAPWTRGPGCGSETRDDHPDMSCDVNGTWAYSPNDSSSTCGEFAQANFQFTSELLYTPIITPAHTGNAANGQPWLYNWLYAEWFFRSDSFRTTIVPTISATQLWTDDYVGGAVPETNAINLWPLWMGAFYGVPNTDWDSAKPWDPEDLPANIDGITLDGVRGEAQPGQQWRWALWQRDTDATFGYTPITNPASGGVSYDDLNLVYHQYHADAQTAVCAASDAPGRVAFDQLTYAGCAGGVMSVSVFDGNGTGPVTVTVTSAGTGDSETLVIAGSAPRWTWPLSYSLAGGVDPEDGVLFVTPDDTVSASYSDDLPVAEAFGTALLGCVAGDIAVEGVVAIDDTANGGDGDGIPDTNEIVDFTIAIRNDGRADLSNVVVTISSTDPDVDCINKDSATIATVSAAGGSASNDLVTDPFTFKVSDATECADASNPPTATFDVFVRADTIDGMTRPQKFTFELDLDALGSTVLLVEDFDGAQPAGWTHQVGPGDDDGVIGVGAAGLTCGPYVDQWFWDSTGGVTGGGFFCWGDPADSFPTGTYADNLDSVLESATVTMPASGTRATLSFDHEYKFADADSSGGGRFALDGVVVHYSVNGGPWTKITGLAYDAELFFNTYCNPECNGGDELSGVDPPATQDCFHENSGLGERVFNALGDDIQDWVTATGEVWGLHAGDQVRFRWRAGSMNSGALGLGTDGGYGLDNVQVDAGLFECDTTVRPDEGCVATSVPAPPVGDGVSGAMMLASRGASADDVDMTFDAATCSGDRAVVVYGNLGNFGAYQGAVASGCDAGSSGAASFTQSGSYWFNVVWVNADEAAGHPGESTAGPRAWTAAGLCAVATDDTSDAVCD